MNYVCGTHFPFMRDIGRKCEPFDGAIVAFARVKIRCTDFRRSAPRQSPRPAGGVDAGDAQRRPAQALRAAPNLLRHFQRSTAQPGDAGANLQHIVEAGRREVVDGQAAHHEDQPPVALQRYLVDAQIAQRDVALVELPLLHALPDDAVHDLADAVGGAVGGGAYDYIGYIGMLREKKWGLAGRRVVSREELDAAVAGDTESARVTIARA